MIVPWYQLWMLFFFQRADCRRGDPNWSLEFRNHHETPKRIAEPAWDFANQCWFLWFEVSDPSKYHFIYHFISFHIHLIRTEPSKYQISMLISIDFYDLIGRNPLKSELKSMGSSGPAQRRKDRLPLLKEAPSWWDEDQDSVRRYQWIWINILCSYWKISDMDNI